MTEEHSYIFTETQDWFSGHIPTWKTLFPLVSSQHPRALEIGIWEGRSSVFLLENLCAKGELVAIDHFDLFATDQGRARHERVLRNMTFTGAKFRVIPKFSVPGLMTLLGEEMESASPGFDWIYIDGSHEADDTFLDGELAWRLARRDAVIVFDDYHWPKEPMDSQHHPKRGIDAFLALHEGEYKRLSNSSQYQMILQKTTEMRIGFLADSQEPVEKVIQGLEYGINIAIAADHAYALAAAVCIRSVIQTTCSSRITVYIIDCGLDDADKTRLQDSLRTRDDVTLKFVDLPNGSLADEHGACWAKIDCLATLPVERVLYLDADLLVRKDIADLWSMSLGERIIGAVVDIGFPVGHNGAGMGDFKGSYFNAGVMLVDLAKARVKLEDLKVLTAKMVNARFKDQDALNVHFQSKWAELPLIWNAQGLGTYASIPAPGRESLDLAGISDPSIVHFTGPLHPPMEDVLNPYVQPFTAKPWGYAGAPGHPFASDWWKVARETSWRDWIENDFEKFCNIARGKAIDAALVNFARRLDAVAEGGNEVSDIRS